MKIELPGALFLSFRSALHTPWLSRAFAEGGNLIQWERG